MTNSQYQYIALLRGINVGGHSIIKMSELRELFEASGLSNVSTYIQTGNVLFTSTESGRKRLGEQLTDKLESLNGKRLKIFILTPEDLKQAADNNPFNPNRFDSDFRSHIVFLSDKPDVAHTKALMNIQGDDYLFKVQGKIFYYAFHKKYEGHTRRNINFEKILGVDGTARNSKVVDKLVELSSQ